MRNRMSLIIRTWYRYLLTAGLIMVMMSINAWAQIAIPELKSRVTDMTATLPPNEILLLEQKLSNFEEKKGSQVAVLIVPTTHPETIEQYAFRVAESWKIGRKNIDDGALLVIAKNDRTLRIDVGYGLEGAIPDAKAKQVIEQIIIPQFKSGNFTQGIGAGVDAILRLIQGESLPSPIVKKEEFFTNSIGTLDIIVPILIGFFILGKILEPLLGRLGGAILMSIGAGFISWLLIASIAIAITVAIFALIMNLFHSPGTGVYRSGRNHWPSDPYRGGGGGFGGGGGGFGGGGGGFGGGGGGFGGGGASGRW